jgi:hypothetical protein
MIYVPDLSYSCYVVQSDGVIRGYREMPAINRDVNYRDWYINSSYIYRDGTQSFGNWGNLPVCLETNQITDEVYYRNDFDSILIIFLIMCIFCFYIPLKVFLRLFRRFN